MKYPTSYAYVDPISESGTLVKSRRVPGLPELSEYIPINTVPDADAEFFRLTSTFVATPLDAAVSFSAFHVVVVTPLSVAPVVDVT